MEKHIKERFNDAILRETMRRYGIAEGDIQLLDGFESFIYSFQRGGDEFILRIGHSLRRTEGLIEGEVDWINYLARGGAGVAAAVLSGGGKLVESIPDGQGEAFLATAFNKASGHAPHAEDWNPVFYEHYGRLIGRMNALAHSYHPSHAGCVRPLWDDPMNMYADRMLPPSETHALEQYQALITHLRALPKDESSYGLIHQDAHTGNLFVDDDLHITLFDFDDCCYGHFIYDIAMVLFYAALFRPDPEVFTHEFMTHFLAGYRQENELDPEWLKEIPHYMKLREIDLYAVILDIFDIDHVDDPWAARFMQGRKERIDADVPVLDFDFVSLIPVLTGGDK